MTPYLARTNYINPQNCANYAYTMSNLVSFSDGTEYTQRVMDKLGIKADGTSFARYDAAKADEYKSKAIEELTAKGVTFPVEIDYYIKASDQTALDNANVMKQMFSDCLGDDFVTFNIKTYVSSVAKEVRNPQLASFYVNAWGADYGDPQNFLGQETYGDDNAWYSTAYSKANIALFIGQSFWVMCASIIFFHWMYMAKNVRNLVFIYRDREYNLASRCLGTRLSRVLTRNILPYLISVIILRVALSIPSTIGLETTLSYLGLGLDINIPSLGILLRNSRAFFLDYPYLLIFPAVIVSLVTITFYLAGNAFSDAADPRNHV